MSKRKAKGNAIGKIILVGEHAVVYGKPAIAIPFSGVSMEVTIEETNTDAMLSCFSYEGLLKDAPERFEGLTSVIYKVLDILNEEASNFSIKIESSIPVERGMGSSAAVSAATIRALFNYFDKSLSDDLLVELVNHSEKITHGNPSGIDTAIVVYEKPLYYIKGEPIETYEFTLDATLIVADTGKMGNTKYAVSKVRTFTNEFKERGKQLLDGLESIVKDTRSHLENNSVKNVAHAMNNAQRYLSELGVSNDSIETLVSTSLDNGALASKLTGGGLGGCVITLSNSFDEAHKISDALLENGAKATWIMDMSGEQYEG